jgi:uncharacterized membrane protein
MTGSHSRARPAPGRHRRPSGYARFSGARGRHGRRAVRTGIPLAIASAGSYGVSAAVTGGAAARTGWLLASLIPYGASVAVLLAALPFRRRLAVPAARSRSGWAWAAVAGVAEAAALAALALGGQARQAAVTSALSSLYPVLPVAAGVVMFRERITRGQVLGIAAVLGGIALVSAASAPAPGSARCVSPLGCITGTSRPWLTPGPAASQVPAFRHPVLVWRHRPPRASRPARLPAPSLAAVRTVTRTGQGPPGKGAGHPRSQCQIPGSRRFHAHHPAHHHSRSGSPRACPAQHRHHRPGHRRHRRHHVRRHQVADVPVPGVDGLIG